MKKFFTLLLVLTSIFLVSCDLLGPQSGLVSFDSNGGSSVPSQNAVGYVDEPITPTYTGHTLVGWYSDVNLTKAWNFKKDRIKGDMILYAKWEINEYTITYNSNEATGGTVPTSQVKKYDEEITISSSGNLERTGYVFASWNTKADGTGDSYEESDKYTKNEATTLYAIWKLPITKLTQGSYSSNNFFGTSVGLSGSNLIVGTDSGSEGSFDYVNFYSKTTNDWESEGKIYNSDNAGGDDIMFGKSVSIDGNTAIVGAPTYDSSFYDAGAAFIYTLVDGKWTMKQKLAPTDLSSSAYFGTSVYISGDTAIIGAFRDDATGSNSGSAYVYTNNNGTWELKQKLKLNDGDSGYMFGYSLCLYDNDIVVGAPCYNGNEGCAFVFSLEDNVWVNKGQIIPNDAAAGNNFGQAVSIYNNTIFIGAPNSNSNKGSVYTYNKTANGSWNYVSKIVTNDGVANDKFGVSICIFGDKAIIGNPNSDGRSGSAYVFKYNGSSWNQLKKLVPTTSESYQDKYGAAVSMSDKYYVVGAPEDKEKSTNSGCAYVYNVD